MLPFPGLFAIRAPRGRERVLGPGAPESSSPSRASDGGQIAESLLAGMNAQRTVRKRPARRRSTI